MNIHRERVKKKVVNILYRDVDDDDNGGSGNEEKNSKKNKAAELRSALRFWELLVLSIYIYLVVSQFFRTTWNVNIYN